MDLGTQEAFRGYISDKIQAHSNRHGCVTLHLQLTSALDVSPSCKQSLEEIGLLVRKLREAIVATHRHDSFATEGMRGTLISECLLHFPTLTPPSCKY